MSNGSSVRSFEKNNVGAPGRVRESPLGLRLRDKIAFCVLEPGFKSQTASGVSRRCSFRLDSRSH